MSDNHGIPPQPSRLRRSPAGWAMFALWVALAIGLIWLAFNLPPGAWAFLRGVFRVIGAFT
ncbi:hypothetical protein [Devosia sp. SL43]|uniref:hypothetical protein n=1 Tax=Devosia sp. SL43 TaxID=2806348 RepID=UPI001F3BC5C7|nr:hypothetical protein [Devosia sp. SL43]UJW85282.1 hypothetical protein IM737_18065 [Devosia sp. SL43]